MGQYGSSSLQERIERRRKQDRAKRRKKLIIALIVVILLAAIGFGISAFSNRDSVDEPIIDDTQITQEKEEAPVVEPEQDETEEPEKTPEETPEEETPTEEPEEAPAPSDDTDNTEVKSKGFEDTIKMASENLVIFMSSRVVAQIKSSKSSLLASVNTGEIDPNKPMIALTFDDGPHAKNTVRILDALEKVHGRATFFVLGELVDGKSEILKRASDMGCEIGNHSFDHSNFTKLSADEMKTQLSKTSNLVKAATGKGTGLTRIPYGSVNETIRKVVGTPMIGWSLDTRDWESRNADKVVDKVLKNVKDGDIIIMHDIYSSTADAVERLIPELRAKGYQLVTVSELMEARGIKMVNGRVFNVAVKKD